MKNFVTSALHALEARRADHAWSRLDRQLGYPALDPNPVEDTTEMRHFLAVQTSQTV
ncbi:hypothetical protein SAMN04488543_3972 [Friedmanniella luteola]|uniref:Uncharacterized protein n=1 Tax=Friedmanniella luteola TaxID=546871 RepID=A0A1H1ZSA4_9ACTN|nr:hypothetical protein [Friedmanniella luteola]SDT36588.1 hypothetical protein SAMN04488543_3972 [Friedmanniella luteola]